MPISTEPASKSNAPLSDSAFAGSSDVQFVVGAGIGGRFPVSDHFAVRIEADDLHRFETVHGRHHHGTPQSEVVARQHLADARGICNAMRPVRSVAA